MSPNELRAFFERDPQAILADPQWSQVHAVFLAALEQGTLRAASREGDAWQVLAWVKQAILIGFRASPTVEFSGPAGPAFDRAAFPPRQLALDEGIRLVPGGSMVRRGAFLDKGVVILPPSFVNVGASIGARTLVDSHVLVGSCAQIGADVHLAAGCQIGGVLEPPGALPVIVEDGAFVGGLCGLFEGVRVGARAVLAPGVILSAATKVYDLMHEKVHEAEIPPNAVVVPGSRPARGAFAGTAGLQLYAPVIVKYRDGRTDAATALEEALR